jgi:hypothetical protein
MKTAVSLPDDLFAEAESYARARGPSRSHLYAAALREFLVRHTDDAITAAINAAIDADPHAFAPDPALQAAVGRSLAKCTMSVSLGSCAGTCHPEPAKDP